MGVQSSICMYWYQSHSEVYTVIISDHYFWSLVGCGIGKCFSGRATEIVPSLVLQLRGISLRVGFLPSNARLFATQQCKLKTGRRITFEGLLATAANGAWPTKGNIRSFEWGLVDHCHRAARAMQQNLGDRTGAYVSLPRYLLCSALMLVNCVTCCLDRTPKQKWKCLNDNSITEYIADWMNGHALHICGWINDDIVRWLLSCYYGYVPTHEWTTSCWHRWTV